MTTSEVKPLIAVNVGNTSLGIGVFDRCDPSPVPTPQVDLTFDSSHWDPHVLSSALPRAAAVWCVASVFRPAQERLRRWVREHRPEDAYHLLSYRDYPLRNTVERPESLGADRWAGAVAANALRHPNHGAIVVDAGTAITVNAISAQGVFLGGAIFPGRQMSASALSAHTDLLPLVEIDGPQLAPPALGTNTEKAIRSGLYWGTVGAIRQLIHELGHVVPSPRDLFVTGGGMVDLVGTVGSDATFDSDLVLRGIAITSRAVFPATS
jgi:type III pantothenate kinase